MAKRALLIGSPYGNLKGPDKDVELMANLLLLYGFDSIKVCRGKNATRAQILKDWRDLINSINGGGNDTVVIYYSGHGGLVQPTPRDNHGAGASQRQFIVPMDYDRQTSHFSGILDVELSNLLQDTTSKTTNVTLILDCCHSGSMTRDPSLGNNAAQKSLFEIQYHSLNEHLDKLRSQNGRRGLDDPESNRNAVRIVAGTTDEKAWEYKAGTIWAGALTKALVKALREVHEQDLRIPWRTAMAHVRELVKLEIATQHPHVEGPASRRPFETELIDDAGLRVEKTDGRVYIAAGHLEQVYDGNEYSIHPFGTTHFDARTEIATARVEKVVEFQARISLSPEVDIPKEGAVAFLRKRKLPKMPLLLSSQLPPAALEVLRTQLSTSKYLEEPQDGSSFARFEFNSAQSRIILYNNRAVEIRSQKISDTNISATTFDCIFQDAEKLARAQHLMALKDLHSSSPMTDLSIEFNAVENNAIGSKIDANGTGRYYPGDRLCISLLNRGGERCYVNVFNVNVAGNISLVTRSSGAGRCLEPRVESVIGKNHFDDIIGLPISWPREVPRLQEVVDSLVFILTDRPVELQHLAGSAGRSTDDDGSLLERLADLLEDGGSRDWGGESGSTSARYSVQVTQFLLGLSSPVCGRDIPEADGWKDSQARNFFDLFKKDTEPFVWVVNRTSEEITVVVSQYGPNRRLAQLGVEGNVTGGGINFDIATWDSPATQKTLGPKSEDRRGMIGKFPLWKNKNGFGVITIFTGTEKKLFVQNDRIDAGMVAFFSGYPDMEVKPYHASLVESS